MCHTCRILSFAIKHHLNLCVATAWDFFSDSYILFAKVLGAEGECKENIARLVIPWLTCYAIATVVSVVALSIKAIIFRDQIRRRRTEFKLEKVEQTDRVAKFEKHNKRLTKIKRQIRLVYSSTLVGFFEYAPARLAFFCGGPCRHEWWRKQVPAARRVADHVLTAVQWPIRHDESALARHDMADAGTSFGSLTN